ncbi:MAG: ADP-ribosylglycohydrolase family protein, partial [Solirubrobacterales bacterium]|nr:ADP-ribosylglycohydrolase family protein [Solirubrobacterales bacterium]
MRAGLVAFAAGDALGSPYEGRRPRELPREKDLHAGETTDDTSQLLHAAAVLAEAPAAPPQELARAFLARLAGDLHERSGPSTRAAVERFRATGAVVAEAGTTNGTLMRAPAVGWAIADPMRRREVAFALGRATHGWAAAAAGVLVADLAAWAVEGRVLRHAVADTAEAWYLRPGGIGLGARDTFEALCNVVHRYDNPSKGIRAAVKLGGDTDTLAALVGGVLGCRDPWAVDRMRWLDEVALPEGLDALGERLAAVRG